MFVNPSARQGAGNREELKAWLKEHDFHLLNPEYDPAKDDMIDLIEKYKSDCTAIIIGGGDGSVNHALPKLTETGIPLLLIPLGTANNLARTLKIPSDPLQAITFLQDGRTQKIDVGMANKIPFMNVVGLGLSTQVNRLTRGQHKKYFGVLAFIATALKVAWRMSPFRAEIICGEKKLTSRTWQITICNGRNYGSGLTIHEEATLNDEKLHGLTTEIKKWGHAFALIPSLFKGKFRSDQDVTCFSGTRIQIRTRRPMHVDIDGDVKTKTPLDIEVLPKALNVFVGPPSEF